MRENRVSVYRFSLATVGQFFKIGRMASVGISAEGAGYGKAFSKS